MHCSCSMNSAPGAGLKKRGLKCKTSKRGRDPNAHIVFHFFLLTGYVLGGGLLGLRCNVNLEVFSSIHQIIGPRGFEKIS